MVTRLRSTWLAGGGATLLVLSLSGIVAGATLVGDGSGDTVQPADPPAGATDTTLTFEDLDGNGIDDDCQDPAAAANPVVAARSRSKAADLNGDGAISRLRSRPERLDRRCELQPRRLRQRRRPMAPATRLTMAPNEAAPTTAECPATEPAPAPAADEPMDTSPNAHGTAVSKVAQSDAVGGKNCNHGGAVERGGQEGPLRSTRQGRDQDPTARARVTESPSQT